MSDLQEFEKTRKLRAASFMMKQHRQACEEQGDDPEEVDTFYSLAADALSRALPAVQPDTMNDLIAEIEFEAVNGEIDRHFAGRIITALRALLAMQPAQVNETPKSEHVPDDVLTPATKEDVP